jgi:hypothetical protein
VGHKANGNAESGQGGQDDVESHRKHVRLFWGVGLGMTAAVLFIGSL